MQVKTATPQDTVGYGRTYKPLQPITIALISCGYADGLPRHLSNIGYVLINGQKCSLVGRVSMDQFTADVSQIKNISIGQEVVMPGVDEMANLTDTIPHEILTRISPRVTRIYK